MPRDGAATAQRILTAAVEEFSRHGLAGARVERIAQGAEANIRLVYSHFGSKERLFEAALEQALTDLATAVPVDAEDLPGWAGAVFDYHRSTPAAWRMNLWRELERPDAGPETPDLYAAKLAEVARNGAVLPPLDLLVLLFGMAQAWWTTPRALREAGPADHADRVARHRASLVAAARGLLTAPAPDRTHQRNDPPDTSTR